MEKEENGCLAKLPTKKAILVMLIVLATAATLIFIHLSGQWIGQQVFQQVHVGDRPAKSRLRLANKLTRHRQSQQRTRTSWRASEDVLKNNDVAPLDERSTDTSMTKAVATILDDTEDTSDSILDPSLFINEEKNQTKSSLPPSKTTALTQMNVFRNQTVGLLKSTADKVLQGVIRAATKYKKPEEPTTTKKKEKKKKASYLRNCYDWNDRDPKAYTRLPLRGKDDRKWKREETLIFNRVGKCGSRSVIELLRKLSDLNDFNLISSVVYNTTLIIPAWQRHMAQVLDHVKTPYLFQRHVYFIDFAEYKLRQPMYINIIRDPLARFVSNYYFKRFGDGKSDQNFKGTKKDKYMSVTECILQRHSECVQKGQMYIIPFFCGQHRECRKPSQWALDMAKQNVEKHFVAVGILEDLENTFRVFEKLLPRYFKGVVKLYLEPDDKQLRKNSSTLTKFKEKPSPEAAAAMTSLLNYEYEFYYFVKDRLEALKKQYGIGQES